VGTSELAEAGRRAATKVYRAEERVEIDDPLRPAFAEAALKEFTRLQEGDPGYLKRALERAEQAARDLDIDPFHGIIEVLQNADDAGASKLRLALRERGGTKRLLFAHDGSRPVRFQDVVAMAVAFLSTKEEEAMSKGRFGIGLKTLRKLGTTLTVHCGPYHAAIEGSRLRAVPAAGAIKGFFAPAKGETLFELDLTARVSARELGGWLERFGAKGLLFLDGVRTVSLAKARSFEPAVELRLGKEAEESFELQLGNGAVSCERLRLAEPGGRAWDRYTVDRSVPASAPQRTEGKKRAAVTPLGVAIPADGHVDGRMYAGLPLGEEVGWPFSVNAQFDVDTPRKGVPPGAWNEWLLERSIEAIVMIARRRFETDPASGWGAVPLFEEVEEVENDWLRERLEDAVAEIQRRVFRGLKLEIEGEGVPVEDLAYEAKGLAPFFTADDLRRVVPGHVPLPRSHRDPHTRFRRVLEEQGEGWEVDVARALDILEEEDEELADKKVGWFIKLGAAAVRAGEREQQILWRHRSVILRDGSRVEPPEPEEEGEMLVKSVRKGSLAAKLGVARPIHNSYLTTGPDARTVRSWLEREHILGAAESTEATLRACAGRGRLGGQPVALALDELLDLRKALMDLEREDREELGPWIGAAITVEGYRYEKRPKAKRDRRVSVQVRPAGSYLPPGLEDRPKGQGWTAAAARTPGVSYIAASYENEIKRGKKGKRPLPAAAAFFRLLGCEVAPHLTEPPATDSRHHEPATEIPDEIPESQMKALGSRHATHLRGDRISRDLERVVTDIAADRSKARRRERAGALLDVLDREWERLYAEHEIAEAVVSDYIWERRAAVPATWLAVAMDTPWMTDLAGRRARPRDLVAKTPLNEAIHGPDFKHYADITGALEHSPALRALGVETDPEPTEVVDRLKRMRDEVESPDENVVAALYLALSAAVGDPDAVGDELVGDLTVSRLRTRFSEGKGLVFTETGWRPRAGVYRGKAIFGSRRAAVPCSKEAERLWQLLEVPLPDIGQCIEVLKEIARNAPSEEDELEILPSVYRALTRLASAPSKKERQGLAKLPLWTGECWSRKRPMYLIEDESLAEALSGSVRIWHAPLAAASLGGLLELIGVVLLDDTDFAVALEEEEDLRAGEPERPVFAAAIAELRTELARNDPELYESLEVGWEDLAEAEIAIKPGLILDFESGGKRVAQVPGRAHIERSPLRVVCAETDVLATRDCGRAIAALFSRPQRRYVEHAWPAAWEKARHGDEVRRVRLAEEQSVAEPVADVLRRAQQAAAEGRPKEEVKAAPVEAEAGHETSTKSRVVRRLKPLDELTVVAVERPAAGEPVKRRGRRGLREDLPEGSSGPKSPPAPQSAPQAYKDHELQHHGYRALEKAIGEGSVELRDFQRLRGVGADAMQEESFFELKSHGGAMPDHVGLTPNEYEQAVIQGSKYFLVVVAGLEEGHETVVRLIPNPAKVLEARSSSGIEVYGIRSVAKPVDIHLDA